MGPGTRISPKSEDVKRILTNAIRLAFTQTRRLSRSYRAIFAQLTHFRANVAVDFQSDRVDLTVRQLRSKNDSFRAKKMSTNKIISLLFYTAAFYNLLGGALFAFAAPTIFELAKFAPPSHWGYVEYPAWILMIFGALAIQTARKPEQNRNLIPYGAAQKLAFAGVVIYYWIANQLPSVWYPFALVDLLFLGGFVWAMISLAKTTKTLTTY